MSGTNILLRHQEVGRTAAGAEAGAKLAGWLSPSRVCGDLLSLDYESAVVLVHDKLRADVGGVSKGCFLIASRMKPGSRPDPALEDTAVVLLRVIDKAPLPNAADTERMRFEAGSRVSDGVENWDDAKVLDKFTANFLRFAGVRCRVLGTFLLRSADEGRWSVVFGADLSNFYSGRGMKVYKPDGEALRAIANYERPPGKDAHELRGHRIEVGRVRYSASEREGDTTGLVSVTLDPTDLIARRTALFGMSRTGKSNTVKVIASSVFNLRSRDAEKGRVGQLILDANGEYANENAQDRGSIRNVWCGCLGADASDVMTYGLYPNRRDPKRRLVRLNFFGTDPANWADRDQVVAALTPLIEAKGAVDAVLAESSDKYIAAFRNASFDIPTVWDRSAQTRYKRAVTAYRAILVEAGLAPPLSLSNARLAGLVGDDLRKVLVPDGTYTRAGIIFGKQDASWSDAREAFDLLGAAIRNTASVYQDFNKNYRNEAKHEGRDWHDTRLTGVLSLLEHRGGLRLLGKVAPQHSPDTTEDYAAQIVADLKAGKLVIVDQSTGDPDMNQIAADRLMWRVFNEQKSSFIEPQEDSNGELLLPRDILVYVEEAHNLLPKDGADLKGIWPRTAKEGSKYRIGLLYATQEPSSILTNILSNTDNWFVAHLNRGAEMKQVKDFYDFSDFEQQILNVSEPGFIRMRTLSNPYVVPVQITPYQASESAATAKRGQDALSR